ncbi:MAG: hypothetical protein NTV22_01105 [bacterium]|nr:hypothetical protein [bacterium]
MWGLKSRVVYLIKGENTIKLQRDTGPLPNMAGIIISAPTDFADKTVAGDGLKVESLRLKAGGGLVVNSRVVSSFKTEDRGPRTEDRTLRTEEQIRDTEVAPTLQTMPLALASSATGADGSRFHPAIVAMNVGAGDFAPPNGGDSIRRMQRLQKTALCGLQSSLRQQNPPAPCATPFSKGGMLQIADLGSRISDLGPRLPFSSSATLSITPLTLSSVILSGFSGLGPAAAYAASPDGNGVAENGWVEADDVFGEAADTDPTQLLSDLGSELGVDRYSEFSLPWIMAVVSRNVAMQLATSDAQANAEILKAVEAIHTTLGIELNKTAPDRNKGWKNTFFVRQMLDEDIAVNPDHFMLFAVCLVLMLVSGRVVTDWGRTSANNTGAIT